MAGDLAVLFFEIGESAIARHQTLNLLGACGLRDGAAQLLLLLEGEFEGLLLHELLVDCGVGGVLGVDYSNFLATDLFL